MRCWLRQASENPYQGLDLDSGTLNGLALPATQLQAELARPNHRLRISASPPWHTNCRWGTSNEARVSRLDLGHETRRCPDTSRVVCPSRLLAYTPQCDPDATQCPRSCIRVVSRATSYDTHICYLRRIRSHKIERKIGGLSEVSEKF